MENFSGEQFPREENQEKPKQESSPEEVEASTEKLMEQFVGIFKDLYERIENGELKNDSDLASIAISGNLLGNSAAEKLIEKDNLQELDDVALVNIVTDTGSTEVQFAVNQEISRRGENISDKARETIKQQRELDKIAREKYGLKKTIKNERAGEESVEELKDKLRKTIIQKVIDKVNKKFDQ